jgi:small subunit ribosomal protein S6
MNIYENIIVFDAALTDEEADAAISKIKELIAGNGGEVLKVDIWGRKKLAYEIKKQKKGLYVLMFYKTPPTTLKKLEEFYKVFDAILKFMIIKLGSKQITNLEKSAAVSEQKSEV